MDRLSNTFHSLRTLMSERGFTQRRLAQEIYVYEGTLSDYMGGKHVFPLDVVWAIMKALRIPANEMHLYFGPQEEGGDKRGQKHH